MDLRLVLCVLVVVVAVQASRITRATSDKFEHINLDDILKSERLLNSYINCFLSKGKCTPDAKEVKKEMNEILLSNCGTCSKKQKEGMDKIMVHIINTKPVQWDALEKKFDPTGSYYKKYREERDAAAAAKLKTK